MEILAATVRAKDGAFMREKLHLAEPQGHEVLVRIVATGMCNSDLAVLHQHYPLPMPWVLGHEGAGVVERVGAGITHLRPGDHVVLTFDSCGRCAMCETGHPAYCEHFFALNTSGRRADGSATLEDSDHATVNGCFFGQSSFASFALGTSRNTVKVRQDAPLELLGPLGCGFQTGAGTVLNVLKPEPGSSMAVFGAGAVGLAAVMAAKIARCGRIVVIDRVASRLELAKSLGATETIDAIAVDAVAVINASGGVNYAVEATGLTAVVQQAAQVLKPNGTCAVLGTPRPGATLPVDLAYLSAGRSICGVVEGDANPPEFIPFLVDQFLAGQFPIDRLATFYGLEDINVAMADAENGNAIKPIIWLQACHACA